jgi:hypothetical protein
MVKASALYIVIIIALVIGLLCSSLIVAAYFYKSQYQQKFRYDQLENNVQSGVNILLAVNDSTYDHEKTFSLFGNDADSVSLQRLSWGIYDVGISRAFIQRDTLYKTFTFANAIDSSKWAALYLEDQDRSLSLSGETDIIGNAFIPKAGVMKAYVNNKSYQGNERLVVGQKKISEKKLPQLANNRVSQLAQYLSENHANAIVDSFPLKTDTFKNTFLKPTRSFNFRKKVQTIKDVVLSGNIILFSDTTLVIDNSAVLDNILVFARSIIVKSSFHGTCQLFATDSIHIEPDCTFDYPSCLGVLRSKSVIPGSFVKIELGENTKFNGTIFTYQQKEEDILPLISLDKDVMISGQVYSQGMFKYKSNIEVNGSLFTKLFIYQSSFNLMENMLIDAKINTKALSPYYLTSDLIPVAKKKKKILQWLEKN